MRQFGPYDTQWLTRARFEPTAGRRLRKRIVLAVVALGAIAVVAARGGWLDPRLAGPQSPGELRRQNAQLQADLERARMELAMEQATHADLQRHADEMSARVTELTQQVEFLTSRNAPAGRNAEPPAQLARE